MRQTNTVDRGNSGRPATPRVSLHDFLKTRCMTSTNALEDDPEMFLLQRDQYTDSVIAQMKAKYRTFVDFHPDREREAFRGFRTDVAGLERVMRDGLILDTRIHFMASFAKDIETAMTFAFRPPSRPIPCDQAALGILVRVEVAALQHGGVAIKEEATMRLIWDVWGDIPRELVKQIYVFDSKAHKFVEVKAREQMFELPTT